MAESNAPSNTVSAAAQALDALKTYDQGSSRASLLPIDELLIAALKDPKKRADLEPQLIRVLESGCSPMAREYLCAKLALLGAAAALPALAELVADPLLSTAARNALQAIPGNASTKALRSSLAKAQGAPKVGIINSLGVRRDPAAVGVLNDCLRERDEQVLAAAAAALGEIRTVRAGRALRDQFLKAEGAFRCKLADPMLICAARLSAQGRKTEAGSLLKLLGSPGLPAFIRQAADRALPS